MTSDPNQIRADIEATRSDLSSNVNALADSVRPGNVARRQVDRVTDGVTSLKDRVMGVADGVGEAGSSAGSSVTSGVGSAKDAAASVPSAAARGTRGNPLAAGLIAFGGGWLLGSSLPASGAEQRAATALKDKAQPLTDEMTEAAKAVAADLKEPAQDAVEQVKSSATDSVGVVKDEASSVASNLKDSSKEAVEDVKQQY